MNPNRLTTINEDSKDYDESKYNSPNLESKLSGAKQNSIFSLTPKDYSDEKAPSLIQPNLLVNQVTEADEKSSSLMQPNIIMTQYSDTPNKSEIKEKEKYQESSDRAYENIHEIIENERKQLVEYFQKEMEDKLKVSFFNIPIDY